MIKPTTYLNSSLSMLRSNHKDHQVRHNAINVKISVIPPSNVDTARCMKSSDAHATSSCSKSPDVAPKCCNYRGSHTANYRGCSFYTNFIKQKEYQTKNPPRSTNQPLNTCPVPSESLSLPHNQTSQKIFC